MCEIFGVYNFWICPAIQRILVQTHVIYVHVAQVLHWTPLVMKYVETGLSVLAILLQLSCHSGISFRVATIHVICMCTECVLTAIYSHAPISRLQYACRFKYTCTGWMLCQLHVDCWKMVYESVVRTSCLIIVYYSYWCSSQCIVIWYCCAWWGSKCPSYTIFCHVLTSQCWPRLGY